MYGALELLLMSPQEVFSIMIRKTVRMGGNCPAWQDIEITHITSDAIQFRFVRIQALQKFGVRAEHLSARR